MDFLIQYFTNYGTVGLFVIALAESVFSPILPDLLLIPLAIANPQNAIYYGMVATVASILGGLIGYAIGKMCGPRVIKRFIPLHYIDCDGRWLINTEFGQYISALYYRSPTK